MEIVKKRLVRDDGRIVLFYHFPGTADAEQAAAFEALEADEEPVQGVPPPAQRP